MDNEITTSAEGDGASAPAPELREVTGRTRSLTAAEARAYAAALERRERGSATGVTTDNDAAPNDEPQREEQREEVGPSADGEQPAAKDGYELEVPIEVPQQFFPETEANIREAGVLAKEIGVPAEEMQTLVDHAVSLAVTDQTGVDLSNMDACLGTLMARYGDADGAKIVADAQRAVVRLGPKAAAFLDSTGLGNSPAVLAALAAFERGEYRMSPEKAQIELNKLTKGEDLRTAYRNANHPGHKAAVDRANLLYAIVARGEAKQDEQPKKPAAPVKTTQKMAEDALDAEIARAIKEPGYLKGDKATLARVRELYARRWPDKQ
jgi:hypothetical protein